MEVAASHATAEIRYDLISAGFSPTQSYPWWANAKRSPFSNASLHAAAQKGTAPFFAWSAKMGSI
jgi:hypothetical protein